MYEAANYELRVYKKLGLKTWSEKIKSKKQGLKMSALKRPGLNRLDLERPGLKN